MGKNFRDTLNERLTDPAFRAEWDALEPERQIMKAIIDGREEKSLTQKQLAEKTGITQADISRLENGTGNPSIRTLKRLAAGLGMTLKVEFGPASICGTVKKIFWMLGRAALCEVALHYLSLQSHHLPCHLTGSFDQPHQHQHIEGHLPNIGQHLHGGAGVGTDIGPGYRIGRVDRTAQGDDHPLQAHGGIGLEETDADGLVGSPAKADSGIGEMAV